MGAGGSGATAAGQEGAYWTGERVLAAMRDWARERGEPSRVSDWARADRRRWPPPSLVACLFEGWSEAVAAAGLTPWRGGRQGPAWPEERIERELRAFVAGRDRLPRKAAFRAAGRRSLWDAMERSGGRERWARRLGLRLEPSRPERPSGWSDAARARAPRPARRPDRVPHPGGVQAGPGAARCGRRSPRAAARRRGRRGSGLGCARAPGTRRRSAASSRRSARDVRRCRQSELRQAGRWDLLNAIQRHGGAARWADELGLQVARAGRPARAAE